MHHFVAIGEFKLELQSGNAQFGSKSTILFSRVTLQFNVWPWKTIGHLLYATSSFVQHFIAIGEFKLELQSGNAQSRSKSTIFFSRVTLKFDGWPSKTIGHLFYATSSLVHHFVAIGEFRLELQSGIAQSGSKSTICLAVWPWNLTDDLEKQYGTSPKHYQAICIISSSYVNSNWSYSPETPNLGEIRRFLELRDLEIRRMTFKNNRAPFLCYFKLCAAFRSHWWIQTGVTVRKRPIWVKFDDL